VENKFLRGAIAGVVGFVGWKVTRALSGVVLNPYFESLTNTLINGTDDGSANTKAVIVAGVAIAIQIAAGCFVYRVAYRFLTPAH